MDGGAMSGGIRPTDDTVEVADDVKLARSVWNPDASGSPHGGVLVIHGMAEHRKRYKELCGALASNGFLVWSYDQRGHGESASEKTGRRYISPGNSWDLLVNDARVLLRELWDILVALRSPQLFVIGHSMGSLVARDVLAKAPVPVCGAVLLGTAGNSGGKAWVGRIMAGIVATKALSKPSRLMHRLTFSGYTARIVEPASEFDWLSRDRLRVRAYEEDPYCGEVMSAHFFRELARGLIRVSRRDVLAAMPRTTACLFLSGTEDPVGGYGTGVRWVARQLQAAGHPDVRLRLIDGARHELLHETNRGEVIEEVRHWLVEKSMACQNEADAQQ